MNSKFITCVGNYVQIIRLQCCQPAREPSSCLFGLGEGVVVGIAWRGLWCTAGGWVVGTAWGGVVAWPKYHTHIHTHTCTPHLCTHAYTHARTRTR